MTHLTYKHIYCLLLATCQVQELEKVVFGAERGGRGASGGVGMRPATAAAAIGGGEGGGGGGPAWGLNPISQSQQRVLVSVWESVSPAVSKAE